MLFAGFHPKNLGEIILNIQNFHRPICAPLQTAGDNAHRHIRLLQLSQQGGHAGKRPNHLGDIQHIILRKNCPVFLLAPRRKLRRRFIHRPADIFFGRFLAPRQTKPLVRGLRAAQNHRHAIGKCSVQIKNQTGKFRHYIHPLYLKKSCLATTFPAIVKAHRYYNIPK